MMDNHKTNYHLKGPVKISELPDGIIQKFRKYKLKFTNIDQFDNALNKINPNQIPKEIRRFVNVKENKINWSDELIEYLIELAGKNIDFSPNDYPKAVLQFYDAFSKYKVENLNILVIDDDESMRDSCRQMLSREGYNVKVAEDGYKGLKLIKKGSFDIVILDLKMPGISGIEILEKIKSSSPETIVIVITGYPTVQSAVTAMKLGAYDFLPKPFKPDELNAIIKRASKIYFTIS